MPSSPSNAPAAAIPTAARAETILRGTNLHRSFKMGDSVVTVLKGADITLRRGEFVAIEGRSGSGKSTLLHILAALDGVDSGSLQFQGDDYTTKIEPVGAITDLFKPTSFFDWIRTAFSLTSRWLLRSFKLQLLALAIAAVLATLYIFIRVDGFRSAVVWAGVLPGVISAVAGTIFALALPVWLFSAITYATIFYGHERPKADLRNKHFGFVFQFYYLLPELTVLENTLISSMIGHSALRWGGARAALRERATALLTDLGLAHRLAHRPNQLSGGERQRVAIARALMNDPKVLFADEPTGNLDYETGRQIMAVLEKLHQEKGQTIVMVTHDRALAREADRVLVLRNGKLEKAE